MNEHWEYGEGAGSLTGTSGEERFPWPPAERDSSVAAFGQTWKAATFDPGAFFRRVPRDRDTGPALLYYLIIGVLVAGAGLFWDSLSLFTGRMDDSALAAAEMGFDAVSPLTAFLLTPAVLLVLLYISAGITHVVLAVLGGARHGFGATLRVFCYGYSPGLFGIVPVLGGIVGSIWMVVLLIIGLREAHEADGWKSAVAVLLPFALLLGLMFMAILFIVAAGAALTSGPG